MAATRRLFKRPRGDDGHEDNLSWGDGGIDSLRAEPRVELFRAILAAAFVDFFGTVTAKTSRTSDRELLEAKCEAAWFLLDPEGTPWGDSRRDLCNVIGENADSLRLETARTIILFEDMFADIGKLSARTRCRAAKREPDLSANPATPDKREYKRDSMASWRAKRAATESPEERAARRAIEAARVRAAWRKRLATETPEQRVARRARHAERARRHMARKRAAKRANQRPLADAAE